MGGEQIVIFKLLQIIMLVWNFLLNIHQKLKKHFLLSKMLSLNVINKMNDTSDTPGALKQVMLKTVGERDYSIQEVMHHLLSIKFVSATNKVITASLDGSRRVQLGANHQICIVPSIVEVYATTTATISFICMTITKYYSIAKAT